MYVRKAEQEVLWWCSGINFDTSIPVSRCNDCWDILVELLQGSINGRGSVTERFETSTDLYMLAPLRSYCKRTEQSLLRSYIMLVGYTLDHCHSAAALRLELPDAWPEYKGY